MLTHRLVKNLRHLRRWVKREGIHCYRIYDRDMPEYAVAIDYYEDKWVCMQEYAPPKEIDPQKARDRLDDAVTVVSEVLGIDKGSIFLKTKRRQKHLDQYSKTGSSNTFQKIRESNFSFFVNFTDYLDIGIFLDHRLTRAYVREVASGKRFLNLFGYTGTASVYAAGGGALSTVTVDTSNSYLSWARMNFRLNGLNEKNNILVRDDCMSFLERDKSRYGLVLCDAPTFSNTKKEERIFSVQHDYTRLIGLAASRLEKGGVLLFSTNFRKFKLDTGNLPGLVIKDITIRTIPPDFSRNKKAHYCFLINKQTES
jgi:23S rRNA (guanine2445-N2)-methyltransferase / 23S rRNA (guanine2069-N7)-methyltransferase